MNGSKPFDVCSELVLRDMLGDWDRVKLAGHLADSVDSKEAIQTSLRKSAAGHAEKR